MKWYEDPVYIAMVDCPEIQEGKPISNVSDNSVVKVYEAYYGWYGIRLGDTKIYYTNRPNECIDSVWLPTQSDLQGMVDWKKYEFNLSWLGIHRMFYCKAGCNLKYYKTGQAEDMGNYLMGNSMEQLWLSFVMKERWNKVWEGGKWVFC